MIDRRSLLGAALATIAATAARLGAQPATASAPLAETVRSAERAFADSMARRDFTAFSAHVSPEAIFFGGPDGNTATKGREAVLAAWKPFFDGPTAPFSWTPDLVEVVSSGTLAITSGPVLDAKGQRAGRFNSIWRRESDGRWRVVFDRGCPASRCS